MGYTVTVTYRGQPRLSRQEFAEHLRDVNVVMAGAWHNEFRPLHMTTQGARRYHYARRHTKEVTTGVVRKTKSGKPMAPSGLPLVWSGKSRLLSQLGRITGTTRGARITYGIRAFNFRNPHNPINMREEYLRTLPKEQRRMASVGGRHLVRRFARRSLLQYTIKIG